MSAIHTVGHSTRTIDEFVDLLRAWEVGLLVDVRRFPRSRRHPHFNAEALPGSLSPVGVEYRHLAALGGKRGAGLASDDSLNTGWRVEGFRNYADYAQTEAFQSALNELLDLASQRRAAIMCAEGDWRRCHRRIITDYLLARGVNVRHIMGADRAEAASLTPFAQPQPDGSVIYPPFESGLWSGHA